MKTWLANLARNATPDMDECVAMLGAKIDWLHQFKSTPQDAEWHAEGDVYIHTGMVLQQLYTLLANEAAHIQGARRQALILGALLHDIGKPQRTREVEIRGVIRIASPQHEAEGRSYLAFKLMNLPLAFDVILQVLGLVGEHHMPKLLAAKSRERADYLALSRRADTELLYWLEIADMRGRICPDLNQQLNYLDEFRLFAEEYGVWGKAYDVMPELAAALQQESPAAALYIQHHAQRWMEQGMITQPLEACAKAWQHKQRYPELYVLCGPSGSGKSSWIKQNCKDFVVVSLDELREQINGDRSSQKNRGQIMQAAKEALKVQLRAAGKVVWDATNLRFDFREMICDLGRDYHALVTLVVFLHPEATLFSNNRNRQHSVPDTVLREQLASYEFPTVDEAHRVIYVSSALG